MLFDHSEKLQFGDEPYGLEDLEIVANGTSAAAAVSHNADRDLRANVVAAVAARQLRLASVDYTRKQYGESWKLSTERNPRTQLAIRVTREAKTWIKSAISRGILIESKPDHVGMIAGGAALFRLAMIFRSATLTIRNGFHFESAVLMRLILEQLAWVAAVYKLNDNSLFNVQPQKSIGILRSYLPEAGRMYGDLSSVSHITPMLTQRYLDLSAKDASVTLLSPAMSHTDAYNLLALADMLTVVAELVWAPVLPTLLATVRAADGMVRADPSRRTLTLLEEWRLKIMAIDTSLGA